MDYQRSDSNCSHYKDGYQNFVAGFGMDSESDSDHDIDLLGSNTLFDTSDSDNDRDYS